MNMIPYSFKGASGGNYQGYSSTMRPRISGFNDRVTVIGMDQSNVYNMYKIELGDPTKPNIMVMACMHGTEWESALYTMDFMEQLRDNTFPDKQFRSELLTNFNVVVVPIANPYGYGLQERYTSSGVEMNNDFGVGATKETVNIMQVMADHQPFSFMDCHLFTTSSTDNLILGYGTYNSEFINKDLADEWSLSVGGEVVERWKKYTNSIQGLARIYMGNQTNPHTPQTLSFINEIRRDGYFSLEKINEIGFNILYLYFKKSMEYFKTRKQ